MKKLELENKITELKKIVNELRNENFKFDQRIFEYEKEKYRENKKPLFNNGDEVEFVLDNFSCGALWNIKIFGKVIDNDYSVERFNNSGLIHRTCLIKVDEKNAVGSESQLTISELYIKKL